MAPMMSDVMPTRFWMAAIHLRCRGGTSFPSFAAMLMQMKPRITGATAVAPSCVPRMARPMTIWTTSGPRLTTMNVVMVMRSTSVLMSDMAAEELALSARILSILRKMVATREPRIFVIVRKATCIQSREVSWGGQYRTKQAEERPTASPV